MKTCPYFNAGCSCSTPEIFEECSTYGSMRFLMTDESQACVENDPVNHPSHYTQGKIECIDFITDKKLNFCRGNAVKYIVRAGLKDPSKEIEDLKKAVFYINREIQDLEKKNAEG